MQNIKLTIAYDGTHYLGWQATQMGPSIEAVLQRTLEQILQHPIHLQAASRTDAGVHAEGQIVNFLSAKENLNIVKLQLSLNSLLPKDIVIRHTEFVHPHFHPTLDCIGKVYDYQVCFGQVQLPRYRFTSWHYHSPLDLEKMREAASILIGEHDFTTFCNVRKNDPYENHVRILKNIQIIELENERLLFILEANSFLFRMARNLVGTLVYIGSGKLQLEQLKDIIAQKDRTLAGMTAPAHGLTLKKVLYE